MPDDTTTRRRHLLLVALALVGLAATGAGLALALGGSPAPADASGARRLLARSLSDARGAGSFHYLSDSNSSSAAGRIVQVTVGDAGPDRGRQDITVNGDRFTVLVVGATTYFQGDALAMATSLGIPVASAQAHAGQWISLVSGDSPYDSVTAAVTTASALGDNLTFRATSELPLSKMAGRTVAGVRGPMQPVQGQPARGTATLYVTTGPRPLPLRYVERGRVGTGADAGTLDFSITFSGWGVPVRVSAPQGAIAFASLGVSGPAPAPGPTLFT